MRELSSFAIEEKNKLASDCVWLLAMAITIPGEATPIRIVRNNENVEWPTGSGTIWAAFPFEIDVVGDTASGEVPRVEVRVGNVSRAMEVYIQAYDLYIKNNGYSPVSVNIYVINSKNLSNSDPEVEHVFELKQPKTNDQWATFVLGASNPFNKRFPVMRVLRNHCWHVFKDSLCGYNGTVTTCDKTLTACRVRFANRNIQNATRALTCVITSIDHGLQDGIYVRIEGVDPFLVSVGNGKYLVQNGAQHTFELAGLNSTGFVDYVSGGIIVPDIRFGGFPGVGSRGVRIA